MMKWGYPSVRHCLPPPLIRGGAREYPICNTQYPISNDGHCCGQEKTLFLLCFLGRCPRLSYYGLSALFRAEATRLQLNVAANPSLAEYVTLITNLRNH